MSKLRRLKDKRADIGYQISTLQDAISHANSKAEVREWQRELDELIAMYNEVQLQINAIKPPRPAKGGRKED